MKNIKQLVHREIVKQLIYSSNNRITVKDAKKAINKIVNIYQRPPYSALTASRVIDDLCNMKICKRISNTEYVSAKRMKHFVKANEEQKKSIIDDYNKSLDKIINNDKTVAIEKYFYAFINIMLETEKPMTLRQISKMIKMKYNLPINNKNIKNILAELAESGLISIIEDDNDLISVDKEDYISRIYLPVDD